MEYLYAAIAVVATTGLILLVIYVTGRLDKAAMERPTVLKEVGETLGLEFHEGRWHASSLSHTSSYESARASGSHRGCHVEVMLRCRELEPEDAGKTVSIRLYASGICAEPVVRARLSRMWTGVELMRWGFKRTGNEISGVDQSIGDESFDDEYVLTGQVHDELRRVLRLEKVQWALEGIGMDFIIRDGFVECPLGIDFTGEDLVETIDALVDTVEVIERAVAEETEEERQHAEVSSR